MSAEQPWREGGAGLRLRVRVTPRAGRDEVSGLAETAQGRAIAVRVRAVADKGDANRAAEALMAGWLGVAQGDVALDAGGRSRVKTLLVAGEPQRLVALLEARLAALR